MRPGCATETITRGNLACRGAIAAAGSAGVEGHREDWTCSGLDQGAFQNIQERIGWRELGRALPRCLVSEASALNLSTT